MRISRIISALAGVVAIAAVPATAYAQGEYPPPPPVLTLSSTTITAGDTVTLTGRGYDPGELVSVTSVHRPLAAGRPGGAADRGTQAGSSLVTVAYRMPLADGHPRPLTPPFQVRADATGAFSVRERFNDPGTETETGTGETSGLSASVTLTVLPHGNLPVTGGNLVRLSIIGGSLLVAGAALYLLTVLRRRRRGGPGTPEPVG